MGYIHEEEASAKVIEAIREVLRAEALGGLTSPARLIGQGVRSGEIARQLFLSPQTLDSHRANIKRKLQLENAAELSRAASV